MRKRIEIIRQQVDRPLEQTFLCLEKSQQTDAVPEQDSSMNRLLWLVRHLESKDDPSLQE